MKKFAGLIAIVIMVSGCQTLDGLKNISLPKPKAKADPVEVAEPETPEVPVPTNLAEGERTLRPLPGAAIPDGGCGMVLWTLESQRPVPVFHYVAGGTALINLENTVVELQRLDYQGAGGYGVFESQKFSDNGQISVEVKAQFGLEFEGGAYLERGVLKVADTDGWSIVAPAAGIAGCRE